MTRKDLVLQCFTPIDFPHDTIHDINLKNKVPYSRGRRGFVEVCSLAPWLHYDAGNPAKNEMDRMVLHVRTLPSRAALQTSQPSCCPSEARAIIHSHAFLHHMGLPAGYGPQLPMYRPNPSSP